MEKSHELGKTNWVHDPGELKRLAKALRKGELSATSLAMQYLERIKSIDRQVSAWRLVKPKQVLEEAALRDKELREGLDRGPLHGIPVAIKDIIDVMGYPTRANSKSRKDAKAAAPMQAS